MKESASLFRPQLCFSASLPFALLKLVNRSVPFVCSSRRSRLPCSLSLLLCAFLMLVKESVSLFRPQLCCSAALLSLVAVVCIAEAGERCIAPLLPSALLTTLRSFCFCYHPGESSGKLDLAGVVTNPQDTSFATMKWWFPTILCSMFLVVPFLSSVPFRSVCWFVSSFMGFAHIVSLVCPILRPFGDIGNQSN